MKVHSEEAFETLIEQHLLDHGGYVARSADDFDMNLALIPDDLVSYVRDTQPKLWAKLEAQLGESLPETLLAWFDKAATQRGVLHVLRHGFKFYGKVVRVATFQPANALNAEVEALYRRNRLAIARQVHFDPKNPGLSLDLVLFLNGIPIVTAELKNAMTSQTTSHAKQQYRTDRDPEAPIFRFRACFELHSACRRGAVLTLDPVLDPLS